jgi:DNA-binding transcriptional MerR regulator
MALQLPDKQYFKIGEVAEILDLEHYVLRYWESEFPKLTPRRTKSGQRLYHRSDVELLAEIKRLLYDEKLTIAGAKKKLSVKGRSKKAASSPKDNSDSRKVPMTDDEDLESEDYKKILMEIKQELKALKDLLE